MIKKHPNIKVFTGPDWLFQMFDGFTNPKGTALIKPVIDPYGTPIIGKQVLDDPDWDFIDAQLIPDPNNPSDKRLVRDWLVETDYYYNDEPI